MSTSQSYTPPTAAQLKAASHTQLKEWAESINEQSIASTGTKAIESLSLNKEDLCQALGDHLEIDLTIPPIEQQPSAEDLDVNPAFSADDQDKFQKMYDSMLEAYEEWGEREDYRFSDSPPGSVDPETADARRLVEQLRKGSKGD